jgi:RNA ligase
MTELIVQKCLRSGDTLEDLGRIFHIKCNICEELGVVCLNYSQVLSPMNEPLVQECRALILELGTWNVVSRSFGKFFNYGQPEASNIDWSTARVESKLDGSLISVFFYKAQWHIATRGTADASGKVGDNDMTFRDLVLKTISEMGSTWDKFTNMLTPPHCYSLELTTPENRVVCRYNERKLTLLGCWNKITLQEVPIECTSLVKWNQWPIVQRHSLQVDNFDQLVSLAGILDPADEEGYVVVDANFNRVKVKSPLYVSASGLIAGLANTKQQIDLIRSDKYDDALPLMPDFLKAKCEAVNANLQAIAAKLQSFYALLSGVESQKEFADLVKEEPGRSVLFGLRKGQTIEECFKRMTIDSLVRLYEDYGYATRTS